MTCAEAEMTNSPGRRLLLRSAFAVPLTVAASAYRGAWADALAKRPSATKTAGYALTSPQRAQTLAASLPADVASQLTVLADGGLGRDLHVRAVVHTQGLLPHEDDHDASVQAQQDWRQTLVQALAFRVTSKAAYADKAVAYIAGWLPGYQSSANPVDEAELIQFLFGLDLVRDRLPRDVAERIPAFGTQLAQAYLTPARRVGDDSTLLNNWQSHRVKLATAGAYLSGDARWIDAARAAFVAHVRQNVHHDGSTYDFAQRDAMHYVVYDLEPLLMAASMAAAHGDDWYGATEIRGRLASALEWLAPYARGERQHEEFVRSTVKFDARRAAAHVPGYAGLWQRNEAADLYRIGTGLDPQFRAVSVGLDATPVTRALFSA
jgi:hypothetical protein